MLPPRRWVGRWVLGPAILAVLAGSTAWASVSDDKTGWAVVSAAIAAVAGAFAPTIFEIANSGRAPEMDLCKAADSLAVTALSRVRSSPIRARLHRPMP